MKRYGFLLRFFLMFLISSNLLSCSSKDEKRDALFNKIKLGMTKEQVIKIVGEPDAIGKSAVDSEFVYYYFYTKNLFGKRGSRSVSFDTNGRVELVLHDED